MENMFSNKVTKPLPKTLSDCTKPDPTASNLHVWAERLEAWGKFAFISLIVIGSICSIVLGCVAGEAAYYDTQVVAFAGAFLGSAVFWAGVAFLEYCSYHAIALLVDSLACIVQNTNISANVALYTAQENDPDELPADPGTSSPPVGSRATQATTSSFYKKAPAVSHPSNQTWTCTCGQKNNDNDRFCKGCGKYK